MRIILLASAMLISAPLAAQTTPIMDRAKMGDAKMGYAKTNVAKMDHSMMSSAEHAAIMGNTPANPYAEIGMAGHKKMMAAMGTDASETWTRKMIEHHRSGIAMSKIALDTAEDKETRANAQKVIANQGKEIAVYQSWLKRHGKEVQ